MPSGSMFPQGNADWGTGSARGRDQSSRPEPASTASTVPPPVAVITADPTRIGAPYTAPSVRTVHAVAAAGAGLVEGPAVRPPPDERPPHAVTPASTRSAA